VLAAAFEGGQRGGEDALSSARTRLVSAVRSSTASCWARVSARKVRIARRGIEDKTKLGRHRWVVERTVSWLPRFKRLGLRYDRTEATLRPLLLLAALIINLRRLVSVTEF
jgi:transposase